MVFAYVGVHCMECIYSTNPTFICTTPCSVKIEEINLYYCASFTEYLSMHIYIIVIQVYKVVYSWFTTISTVRVEAMPLK